MKRFNPIPDLMRLGYTEREAAFLYIVGANSGFFLARQYTRFLHRKSGAVLPQLIERGERLGHIRTLDWDRRWRLYHLHSRTIYRLLGQEESRNRHEKSNQEVLVRLMVLDYVLDRLPDEFFNGPEKSEALSREVLNRSGYPGSETKGFQFKDCFPLFLATQDAVRDRTPQFTYFDYGASTIKAFLRHLDTYAALWQSLTAFELIFVSTSERLITHAEQAFRKRFCDQPKSDLLPFGLDHFEQFVAAEQKWDTNDLRFGQSDLLRLKEGERVYTQPEHTALKTAWRAGQMQFKAALHAMNVCPAVRAEFSTVHIRETYPALDVTRGKQPGTNGVKEAFKPISNPVSMAS